ncbi:MAG: RHS repeat-associated core domain-containing protein, partial [Bacteroidales bacterium]|nr:RHS repeat-associated core domain-containing protein [Bacteroidales bacterium]
MQAIVDDENSAYYLYDYSGERTWKIVGAKITVTRNGVQIIYNAFNESVLYLFPEVTVTAQGYTKHIFAGTERICSKVGTGRSWPTTNPVVPIIPSPATASAKQTAQKALIRKVFTNMCIPTQYPLRLCLPQIGSNIMNTNILHSSLRSISTSTTAVENVRYFYNADHLGSTSFVSDRTGTPIQYLSYEPFGKVIHNQKATGSSYNTDWQFSGKFFDAESRYSYFGARYYNSDIGIWLSVDLLAHKYPSLSSYVYCANNPVMLVDPDGRRIDGWEVDLQNKSINQTSSDDGNNTQYVNAMGSTQTLNMSTDDFIKQAQSQGYTVNTFSQTFDPVSQSSDNGVGWGVSLDVNLSVGMGYSFEVGVVKDASGNGSMFYSHGKTSGFEASIGANGFLIPNPNFSLSDFEGQSMSINVSTPYVIGGGVMTDHRQGAENDYYFNNYGGLKFGGGLGAGAS